MRDQSIVAGTSERRTSERLSRQRARYADGARTRAMAELTQIDPTWHLGISEH